MAFEFLRPILTANALATVQANPVLLAYTIAWLLAIILVGVVAWYIHFVTNKVYAKPKKPGEKSGMMNMFGSLNLGGRTRLMMERFKK